MQPAARTVAGMISGLLRMEFPKDRFMGEEDAAARRHAQTPAIGSTRGRLPRLLRARLAALCGLTLPRGEAPRHYLGGGVERAASKVARFAVFRRL